jgi:hypothetical protein
MEKMEAVILVMHVSVNDIIHRALFCPGIPSHIWSPKALLTTTVKT